MALEDLTGAKYLDSLVVGNPVSTDDRREGDDHIRGIKNVLRNTFPNLNGAVTATQEQLSAAYLPLAGGTVMGPLVAAGGVWLGDGAGDALTINSSTASIPNGINLTDGNVGVGGAPNSGWVASGSAYKVVQVGVTGALYGRGGNEMVSVSSNVYTSGAGDRYIAGGNYASQYQQASGDHVWMSAPVGAADAPLTFVEQMRLDKSNNLGLGKVASAGYKFDVQQAGGTCSARLRATDPTAFSIINLANDNGSSARLMFLAYTGTSFTGPLIGGGPSGEQGVITTTGAYPLILGSDNTVRMTILPAGVVSFLFGTKTQRTWQAVGADRNFNTDYTAPAYDIELSSTNTTTANSQLLELLVNGVSVASDFNAGATNTCIRLHGHVIPAGATYRINATANITKGAWSELR